MTSPSITVLMPVHNAASYVGDAIDSILAQSHADFELLVMNDGSSDESAAIVQARRDPRIRLVSSPTNRGIVNTLNEGLSLASGRYVARMDADDLADPGRLARQWRFMEENPAVGVCGTAFEAFGESPGEGWVRYFHHDAIAIALLFGNPICHPTVILRKSVLDTYHLRYPDDHPHAEEYALWSVLAGKCRMANLPDRLLRYRTHAGQVSRQKSVIQRHSMKRIVERELAALGITATSRDLRIHNLLGGAFSPIPGAERLMRAWVKRLLAANAARGRYAQQELNGQLQERIAEAIDKNRRMLGSMSLPRRIRWRLAAAKSFWLTPDQP
jgi:glycosyltransferase involved in cell wall biosynthesis